MNTALVLDALEQATWTRHQTGITEFDQPVHHNDAGSQYIAITITAAALDQRQHHQPGTEPQCQLIKVGPHLVKSGTEFQT